MGKKQKLFIATAGIICVGALVFTVANQDVIYEHFPQLGNLLRSNNANAMQQSSLAAQQQQTMDEADKAIAAAESTLAAADAAEAQEASSANNTSAWTVGSDEQPTTKLNPKIKIFSAVKVNMHPSHLPVEGEQIILPMLNGESVKVNVESSQTSDTGDYVWSGHLDGYNNDYPIVMTYGEKSTFATITTPQGIYAMESVNGVGWLYKNPSEIELSKPGYVDYLEPKM